ncbi:MAG: DUF5717 family protein [Defluviitaleaceae bacterium]|nr:DUF5717 family protein [Defluviitaleaceae bacterium]
MANRAIGKILRYERIYGREKGANQAFVMSLSYYMGYIVSDQRDLLHKANFVLQAAEYQADVGLVFLRCFVAHELDNHDLLEDLLTQLKPLRNAMKIHQPRFYSHYLYFDCLLLLAQQKERAAQKQFRALKEYYQSQNVPEAQLLLANLSLVFDDSNAAFDLLHKAYIRGERGALFYVALLRAFSEASPNNTNGELLLPLILWSLNTGCYIENIIAKNSHLAETMLRRRPKTAQSLYLRYQHDWILHIIATAKMIENDLSQQAFFYYKEADIKQLHFPQLYDFLLRAAHKNGIEDISGYALSQYIKTNTIPDDILPFVYHLVLKGTLGGRHDEILSHIKGDIVTFACRCLDEHLYGKYYYSLYKFLLIADVEVERKYAATAEEIVKQMLFAHDLTVDDDRVRKIVIQEEFKRQSEPHELKDGRLRINLWSSNVKITCFDENLRNIIPKKPTITRLIETTDLPLLHRFFNSGHHPLELLIYLSNHYLQNDQDDLSSDIISVLQITATETGINRAFARMINAALGNYYARRKNFAKAVEYFKDLDEAAINRQYLESMLAAYIAAGDYNQAARLIVRWSDDIADKALFYSLKQMSPHISKLDAKKGMASVAAKLALKGWHDDDLLKIVITHYVAPLMAWIELAKGLTSLGIFDPKLHKKILSVSILSCNSNKSVQAIFVNLAQKEPHQDDVLADFAVYLSYEILTNGFLPEPATVRTMEDIFVQNGEILLAYALCHIYITRDDLSREKSRKIMDVALATARNNDIIFPIFKEIKDKTVLLTYIEKSSPFVYRGRAENSVDLYYKIGTETHTQPMKYFAFGLFFCHIPHFYGESIEYYFSETRGSSSIKTTPQTIINNNPHMLEKSGDLYYTINNALVFEQMFKYDKVEEIVAAGLSKRQGIRAKMM